MREILKNIKPALLLTAAAMLAGCGESTSTVNLFTVFDDRTMSCDQAQMLSASGNYFEGVDDSIRRAAKSKLNWCQVTGGSPVVVVGYFDSAENIYRFESRDFENPLDVSRLCLDIAAANFVFDVPPKNLVFQVQTTIAGDVEEIPCERLAYEMNRRALAVLVAPAHVPLLMDIDPVLVLATGANPRLEGVPHHYYDEVRDILERILADAGN